MWTATGHAQCSDGTVPCESGSSSCSKNIVFDKSSDLQGAIASCKDDDYSEACYITNVGCAPNAWDVSAVKDMSVRGRPASIAFSRVCAL